MRHRKRNLEEKNILEEYLLTKLKGAEKRTEGLNFPQIVPNTHFSWASTNAYELYIFGSYIGAIMLSHSVVEGILKFVCKKQKFTKNLISEAYKRKIISAKSKSMICKIREYRHDFHHMNPQIETDAEKLANLARDCVLTLSELENELFGCTFEKGKIVPERPEIWDISKYILTGIFIRSHLKPR